MTGAEERMGLVWSKAVEGEKMEPTRFVEVTILLSLNDDNNNAIKDYICHEDDDNVSNLKVTSSAAAKMLNIFPRKGCIAEVIHNCDDNDDCGVDYDDEWGVPIGDP